MSEEIRKQSIIVIEDNIKIIGLVFVYRLLSIVEVEHGVRLFVKAP